MANKIDQKAYLQKYLSGPSRDKKKKKKKIKKGNGIRIIVDNIDLNKIRSLDNDELDILEQGEDAPQIAGIIDERPEEIRKLEQFKTTSKWRVISQDDGFTSKLQVEEIKKDVQEQEKENELIFGKMYSDSEDEKKNDSDLSPPRKQDKNKKEVIEKSKQNSDSDISPPRKNKKDDSDVSPTRSRDKQKSKERVRKPSRWGGFDEEKNIRHKSPDSDVSPPRKRRDESNKRLKERKRRSSSSSDINQRKSRKAPKRNNSDSDLSPPRKKADVSKRPPKEKYEADFSPERRKKARRKSSSSDLSPPRKKKDANSGNRYERSKEDDSPPPSNKKMAKTLEGKMAGLQNAIQLREENEAFKRREDEAFKRLGDEVSGRNANAVSRKGKRDTSEERKKQRDKAERQKEIDEKYKKWSKGLKQIGDQEARMQDFIHEASKPLARHKDDKDLENSLKEIERAGDPMLNYIREKKRERGELPPEKPTFKGNFPPNRFNIRPGYRWDGVDRSNGYEKKFFENKSKKKAQEEEYYKWCSADL